MAEHTPTPWHPHDNIHPVITIRGDKDHVVVIREIYCDGNGVGRANAEFLCRAVNCHEELLALARQRLKALESQLEGREVVSAVEVAKLESARELIARAESQPETRQ